jgi:hypothetical protein
MSRTGLPITNEVRIWVFPVNGQTMLHVDPWVALVEPDARVSFTPIGLEPGQHIEIEPKHGGRWQRVTGAAPDRLIVDGERSLEIDIRDAVGARCEYTVYLWQAENGRHRLVAEKDPEFFICD